MGRRLHNELRNLHFSLNILRAIKSRSLRLAGDIARMEECRIAFRMFPVKTIGENSVGGSKYRSKVKIRMDLREMVVSIINWIESTQDMDS